MELVQDRLNTMLFTSFKEQVALNKSSEDTLQLFTKLIKQKVFTKVIEMTSWKAWVRRPSGLIKR